MCYAFSLKNDAFREKIKKEFFLLFSCVKASTEYSTPFLCAVTCLLQIDARQVDACQEVELVGAALQGLLLDFKLWSDAGVENQALLLEGISSVVRLRTSWRPFASRYGYVTRTEVRPVALSGELYSTANSRNFFHPSCQPSG